MRIVITDANFGRLLKKRLQTIFIDSGDYIRCAILE